MQERAQHIRLGKIYKTLQFFQILEESNALFSITNEYKVG